MEKISRDAKALWCKPTIDSLKVEYLYEYCENVEMKKWFRTECGRRFRHYDEFEEWIRPFFSRGKLFRGKIEKIGSSLILTKIGRSATANQVATPTDYDETEGWINGRNPPDKNYVTDYKKIVQGIEAGDLIPAPIVIKAGDRYLQLNGNRRFYASYKLGIPLKVFMISVK